MITTTSARLPTTRTVDDTAGDGLWRVDFGDLAEEDWGSQWTMTQDVEVGREAREGDQRAAGAQVLKTRAFVA